MTSARIGYTRCATGKHDLAAQRAALIELAVDPDRIQADLDLTGTNRDLAWRET